MTIKEVSKKFSFTPDTLRYYEKVGLIGPIQRTSSGIRDYTTSDLERIEFVKCMRNARVSIEVLKEYLDLFEEGDCSLAKRRALLVKERVTLEKKLLDMQAAYQKLNAKIAMYDEKLNQQSLQIEKEKH